MTGKQTGRRRGLVRPRGGDRDPHQAPSEPQHIRQFRPQRLTRDSGRRRPSGRARSTRGAESHLTHRPSCSQVVTQPRRKRTTRALAPGSWWECPRASCQIAPSCSHVAAVTVGSSWRRTGCPNGSGRAGPTEPSGSESRVLRRERSSREPARRDLGGHAGDEGWTATAMGAYGEAQHSTVD